VRRTGPPTVKGGCGHGAGQCLLRRHGQHRRVSLGHFRPGRGPRGPPHAVRDPARPSAATAVITTTTNYSIIRNICSGHSMAICRPGIAVPSIQNWGVSTTTGKVVLQARNNWNVFGNGNVLVSRPTRPTARATSWKPRLCCSWEEIVPRFYRTPPVATAQARVAKLSQDVRAADELFRGRRPGVWPAPTRAMQREGRSRNDAAQDALIMILEPRPTGRLISTRRKMQFILPHSLGTISLHKSQIYVLKIISTVVNARRNNRLPL
jgi:hypothetical protein